MQINLKKLFGNEGPHLLEVTGFLHERHNLFYPDFSICHNPGFSICHIQASVSVISRLQYLSYPGFSILSYPGYTVIWLCLTMGVVSVPGYSNPHKIRSFKSDSIDCKQNMDCLKITLPRNYRIHLRYNAEHGAKEVIHVGLDSRDISSTLFPQLEVWAEWLAGLSCVPGYRGVATLNVKITLNVKKFTLGVIIPNP